MPAYQVRITLSNDGVILLGLTASSPHKLMPKLMWLNNLLIGLPVVSTEMFQLPGKPNGGRTYVIISPRWLEKQR